MHELPAKISIAGLKARILATKTTGEYTKAIASCKYNYDELVNLFLTLPDRKIRRWHRKRKKRARSVTNERQPNML
jgi:hypothetical protein